MAQKALAAKWYAKYLNEERDLFQSFTDFLLDMIYSYEEAYAELIDEACGKSELTQLETIASCVTL